jgi:hypothetical protein
LRKLDLRYLLYIYKSILRGAVNSENETRFKDCLLGGLEERKFLRADVGYEA